MIKYTWIQFIKDFFYLLGSEQRWKFIISSFGAFILNFYRLIPPYLVGIIAGILISKPDNYLQNIYIIIVGIIIFHIIVSNLRVSNRSTIEKILTKAAYYVKTEGFSRLMEQTLLWHDQENSGNKVQRVITTHQAMKRLNIILISGGTGLYSLMAQIVGVIVIYSQVSYLLSVFAIIFTAVFVNIHFYFARRMAIVTQQRNKSLENASGNYFEGISNVLTIKSLGIKEQFKSNIKDAEKISQLYDQRLIDMKNNKRRLNHTLRSFGYGIFLLITVHKIQDGSLNPVMLAVYFGYFLLIVDAVFETTELIDDMQMVKQDIARGMPIFRERVLVNQGSKKFPNNWQNIKIDNASFGYESPEPKSAEKNKKDFGLYNVGLQIKRGEIIGVVGRSGSGKSTIAKLLLGLYEFNSGQYQIGSTNFYELSHDAVANNISIVLQESELFNMSLKDNITLLQKDDPELLKLAISCAQLEEVIEKLPQGMDTLIGEKGYRVSGGERQRIGIARAIYRNTPILILDEATSNLDNKTESLVQEAIEKNLDKKTLIIIAHRLSTLRNVDRIVVFDKGSIVESGTYKELKQKPDSIFAQLYQIQEKGGAI